MNFSKSVHNTNNINGLPWYIKYQPENLNDITGNAHNIISLNSYINCNNIPNLIITGPSGSGKHTIIDNMLDKYLGKYRKNALNTIYGAITTGKKVISETNADKVKSTNIINFIKKKENIGDKFKIILIYDFDKMTAEAHTALLRIFEKYHKKTRFILTCRYTNNIDEALQSRCLIMRFSKINKEDMRKVIFQIAEKEEIKLSDDVFDIIYLSSNGDLKKAINYLQVLAHAPAINTGMFYTIFNIPSVSLIEKCINHALENDGQAALNIIYDLLESGYNVTDILDILFKVIKNNEENLLNIDVQTKYLQAISYSYYLVEHYSSNVYLFNLIGDFVRLKDPKNKPRQII